MRHTRRVRSTVGRTERRWVGETHGHRWHTHTTVAGWVGWDEIVESACHVYHISLAAKSLGVLDMTYHHHILALLYVSSCRIGNARSRLPPKYA